VADPATDSPGRRSGYGPVAVDRGRAWALASTAELLSRVLDVLFSRQRRLAAGLSAFAVLTALLVPGAVSAQGPANPEVTEALAWDVGQVEPDGRSLQIVYGVSYDCPSGAPQPTLTETATTITIGVQQATYPNENCASLPYPAESITVRLAAPVAGRRIVGPLQGLLSPAVPVIPPQILVKRGKREVQAIPRLLGLAPENALQAIRISGLRTHFCAVGPATGLPRVASQRPSPGRVLVPREMIRVRLAGAGANAARCP